VAVHLLLLIITNAILWKLRSVQDRYQEQKYVALASSYVVEVLLVGVPVLFAIQGSTSGVSYLVLVLMIFFIDFGILCLIFVPKIYFQHIGLPEGVPVTRSILREDMRGTGHGSQTRSSYVTNAGLSGSFNHSTSFNNSNGTLKVFDTSGSRLNIGESAVDGPDEEGGASATCPNTDNDDSPKEPKMEPDQSAESAKRVA